MKQIGVSRHGPGQTRRQPIIEFYIIRDSELCLFSPSPLGEGRGEGLSVPIVILYVTLNSRRHQRRPSPALPRH
jgi:hypothetical protein